METVTLYKKSYYVMQGKTKLGYGMNLDFYDLVDKDLNLLLLYENQTVRYKNKWFVVKQKKKLFYSKKEMEAYPENWIKYPYKKAKPTVPYLTLICNHLLKNPKRKNINLK